MRERRTSSRNVHEILGTRYTSLRRVRGNKRRLNYKASAVVKTTSQVNIFYICFITSLPTCIPVLSYYYTSQSKRNVRFVRCTRYLRFDTFKLFCESIGQNRSRDCRYYYLLNIHPVLENRDRDGKYFEIAGLVGK